MPPNCKHDKKSPSSSAWCGCCSACWGGCPSGDVECSSSPSSSLELPADVIQSIYSCVYSSCGPYSRLGLRDGLRGQAVCKAWHAALSQLPLPKLVFLEEDFGCTSQKRLDLAQELELLLFDGPSNRTYFDFSSAWVPAPPMPVQRLAISAHWGDKEDKAAAVPHLQRALSCCAGQALQELQYSVVDCPLPRLLPQPHLTFPALRRLDAVLTAKGGTDPGWVARLALLPWLESLRLKERRGTRVAAPACTRLTELNLNFAEAVVDLAVLPSLLRLEIICQGPSGAELVWGASKVRVGPAVSHYGARDADRTPEELGQWEVQGPGEGAPPGVSHLTELRFHGLGRLSLNFGWLPKLEQLSLEVGSLEGAASAGAASSLRRRQLSGSGAAVAALLSAVPRQCIEALGSLDLCQAETHSLKSPLSVDALLTFPALRSLALSVGQGSPDLAPLACLANLQSLKLSGVPDPPALPALTYLCLDSLRHSTVELDLFAWPALKELEVRNGCYELRIGSSGANQLARLTSWAQRLDIDFGCLPALEALDATNISQLANASTLGAAASLRCMVLETSYTQAAAAALRAAPSSLRSLGIGLYRSCWGDVGDAGSVAAALAALTQLTALALRDESEVEGAVAGGYFAAGAPCWGHLRALSLAHHKVLPTGVAHAPYLQRLQTGVAASREDVEALGTLPALRHLHLCCIHDDKTKYEAADRVFRFMPYLETMQYGGYMQPWEFLEASMGSGTGTV